MGIFKPILGYEGLYEISSYGNIISLPRGKEGNCGSASRTQRIKLSMHLRVGYPSVALNKDARRKTYMIHLLVWDHFGNNLRNGRKLQVDHIDNNKLNNRINNLQLLTPYQNTAKHHMTRPKTSRYTGICWDKRAKRWIVQVRINKKHKRIGRYKTEDEAYNILATYLKQTYGT